MNVAARLQAAAPAGQRAPSASARAGSARGAIAYRALEPLDAEGQGRAGAGVGGARALLDAHARAARRPRARRRWSAATTSSRCSRRCSTASCARARPHLVTVIGAGRRRQVAAAARVRARARARASPRRCSCAGRCLPFGSSIVYWPLGEMLRAECGIVDGDDRRGRLGEARASGSAPLLARAASEREEAERRIAPLARLLGIEAADARPAAGRAQDPQSARESFFAAVRAVLEALARRAAAGARLGGHPLGRRGHARPDRVPRRSGCARRCCSSAWRATSCSSAGPSWGGVRRDATTIFLEPLAAERDARADRVAAARRGRAGRACSAELAERAGGNPLFAEEMVQRIAEEGDAGAAELPDTVQGLLAARLDSLEPLERRLVAARRGRRAHVLGGRARAGRRGRGRRPRARRSPRCARRTSSSRRGRAARRRARARVQARADPRRRLRDAARRRCARASTSRSAAFIEERAGERADEVVALLAEHYGARRGACGARRTSTPTSWQPLRAKALQLPRGRRRRGARALLQPRGARPLPGRARELAGADDERPRAHRARSRATSRCGSGASTRRSRSGRSASSTTAAQRGPRARRRAAPQDRRRARAQGRAQARRSSTTSRAST